MAKREAVDSCDLLNRPLLSLCGAFALGTDWAPPPDAAREDWEALFELARRHGLLPMLDAVSRRTAQSPVPQELQQKLSTQHLLIVAQNSRLLCQLDEIAQAAAAKAIELVALKGTDCIVRLYGDIGCRVIYDLDLMVSDVSAMKLRDVLLSLGYKRSLSTFPPGIEQSDLALGYQQPFYRAQSAPVDVHVHAMRRRGRGEQPAAQMWDSVVGSSVAPNVRFLAPAHFLLYASRHYMRHRKADHAPLCWITDMLLAVSRWREEVDWDAFWETADRWHIQADAGVVLASLNEHWGMGIPSVPASARPLDEEALVRGRVESMPPVAATVPRAYLGRLANVRLLPDTPSRVAYLRYLLWPPPEVLRERYGAGADAPPALLHARYLAERAFRFVRGAVLLAWRKMAGGPVGRGPE